MSSINFKTHPKTSETIVKTAISLLTIKNNENNGKKSIWVSSEALDNREEHIPYYGEVIGKETDGLVPGEEFGCQCGVGYE